jgi:hypothetical protein
MIRCPNECWKYIVFNDLSVHLKDNCTERLVSCPRHCQEVVKFSKIEEHESDKCVNGRVSCPYSCGKMVMRKVMKDHLDNICTDRPMVCQYCSFSVPLKDLKKHEAGCVDKAVACGNKCGMIISNSVIRVRVRARDRVRSWVCG